MKLGGVDRQDAGFKEQSHVRDERGRFAEKPGYLNPATQSLPNLPKKAMMSAAQKSRENLRNVSLPDFRRHGVLVPARSAIADYVNSPYALSSEESSLILDGKSERDALADMRPDQRAKAQLIMAAGDNITLPEAIGLRSYIEGLKSYKEMNNALRSDLLVLGRESGKFRAAELKQNGDLGGVYDFDEEGNLVESGPDGTFKSGVWILRNRAANQAIQKLPQPTIDQLIKDTENDRGFLADLGDRSNLRNWGYQGMEGNWEKRKGEGSFFPHGSLARVLKIPPNKVADFAADHPEGKIIKDPGFYSTYIPVDVGPTIAQMQYTSNVKYEVDWNPENTAGRFVDHFKEGNRENEILFPPNTPFRVTKAARESGADTVIRVEEVRDGR